MAPDIQIIASFIALGSVPMNDMMPPTAMRRSVNIMKNVLLAVTDVEYADFLDVLDLHMSVSAHRSRM